MKKFIEFALGKASKFGIMDYAMFKICLITFGLIVCAYFPVFFAKNLIYLWCIFIITFAYLIYRMFKK